MTRKEESQLINMYIISECIYKLKYQNTANDNKNHLDEVIDLTFKALIIDENESLRRILKRNIELRFNL